MRTRDVLALIALVIIAVGGEFLRGGDGLPKIETPYYDSPRRPAPHRYEGGLWDDETRSWMSEAPTPSKSAPPWIGANSAPVIEIPEDRESGTGTAFAVADGLWLTARHVVDGCDKVGIHLAPRKALAAIDIRHHPHADVSLIRTKGSPKAFEISERSSDTTYLVGFPKGKPGAVHGRKIGGTTLKEHGRYQTREKVDVWAERSRIPDRTGSLGGLSGGPSFSDDGRVSGVVLAQDLRRGRIFTAQPATLQKMFDVAGVAPAGGDLVTNLNSVDYPRVARELLVSLRIARVLCRVS